MFAEGIFSIEWVWRLGMKREDIYQAYINVTLLKYETSYIVMFAEGIFSIEWVWRLGMNKYNI